VDVSTDVYPTLVALELGHRVVWDPPQASATMRWTCHCGRAVLFNRESGQAYGSATEEPCPGKVFEGEMNLGRWRQLCEDGYTVLHCECGCYFDPGRMRSYGDHACVGCGSLSTGFVHEDSL
jgi:hypothetical protein